MKTEIYFLNPLSKGGLRAYFLAKLSIHLFLNYVIEGEFEMTGSYAASYLPWILIPVVTWLMPIVVMGLLFVYIESDA